MGVLVGRVKVSSNTGTRHKKEDTGEHEGETGTRPCFFYSVLDFRFQF